MVTVWWSAAGLIYNRFLNPGKNHYIWEVCSANQWDSLKTARPAANIGEQNGFNSPWQQTTSCCTTNASKVEIIDLGSFASFTIFTWPLASWLPLLQASRQLFAGKMLPQPAAGRKCFPRVCRIPNHRFLRSRNEHACFLLAKMCWLYNQNMCWFLFWWIKMLFEPCYNDWKSTVQNRSPSKKLCLPQPNNIEPLCAHGTNIVLEMNFNLKGKRMLGLPWWPSAQDSMLPLQGAGVHTW